MRQFDRGHCASARSAHLLSKASILLPAFVSDQAPSVLVGLGFLPLAELFGILPALHKVGHKMRGDRMTPRSREGLLHGLLPSIWDRTSHYCGHGLQRGFGMESHLRKYRH
jgi:hypothetical protein